MSVKQELQPLNPSRVLLASLQAESDEEHEGYDASSPEQLVGRILNQRYVLDELVGWGATAWVFKARDLRKVEVCSAHPYVAIKVLRLDLRGLPEARVGLEREAARSQQLNHSGIVSVFDFDRDGGLFYLVMEWISGPTLEAHLRSLSSGERRSRRIYRLIEGLLQALRYAHGKGVVHADFKPANVIIDEAGQPRILDFGVARMSYTLAQSQGWQTGFNGYTPTYATVSRLKGGAVSVADDTYAIACVIYELLTGQHPYGRRTALEACEAKLKPRRPKGLESKSWRALAKALDTAGPGISLAELCEAFAEPGSGAPIPALVATIVFTALLSAGLFNWQAVDGWLVSSWYQWSGDREFFLGKLSGVSMAEQAALWERAGPSIKARLDDLVEHYQQTGELHALVQARSRAGDWLQVGVQDADLAAIFRWLEQETTRVAYPEYRVLNRVLPRQWRTKGSGQSALETAHARLRLLDPLQPALDQGHWRLQLHHELERALGQGRWSESLALAEQGLTLLENDSYLLEVHSRLLMADKASLEGAFWPQPPRIDASPAASEMLAELIRNGFLEEARQEYRFWIGLEGINPVTFLAQIQAHYQNRVLAAPAALAAESQRWGQQFFAELAADSVVAHQGFKELQAASLELVDALERNASYRIAQQNVALQLNRLAGDAYTLRQGQAYLRQLFQRQLAWHQGQARSLERYQSVAQALLPEEEWLWQEAPPDLDCRDVAISGQRLVNLCRDHILPGLVGPELVLVSDLSRRRAFYMSRHEVTVGDFNLYCRLSQECKPRGEPEALPLTQVSVREARNYSRWLSRLTGQRYRLPLLDEWTLAAEQGEAPGGCQVDSPLMAAQQGVPDRLGLMHLAGNVREFVTRGGQLQVKGGSAWDERERCSITQGRVHHGQADRQTGFRLVREVNAGSS